MIQRVRQNVKAQIDASIATGATPKTPKSGIGLVLPTGVRHRTIIDKSGITTAGNITMRNWELMHQVHFTHKML